MNVLTRIARRVILGRPPRRIARRRNADVRRIDESADARRAAFAFARRGALLPSLATRFMHELLALRTPALYLQVIAPDDADGVVIEPWDQRKISLCGGGWTLDLGTPATNGVHAWALPSDARRFDVYETAPDHPVLAVSVDAGDQGLVRCFVPEYLTHVTVVLNHKVLAAALRIEHGRGTRVLRFGRAA